MKLLRAIEEVAELLPIIFPVHPRTKKNLKKSGLLRALANEPNVIMTRPLGYRESLSLLIDSKAVITDSGGLQEESSALKIPCLTLRMNTERPVTIEKGTNTLIKGDWKLYQRCINRICKKSYMHKCSEILYWDGRTAGRILRIITNKLKKRA